MGNEITGRAKGGIARAEKLTPERRKEISVNAARVKKALSTLPKLSHRGEIKIGDMTISCCVLEDGRRLISESGITNILGATGGKSYKLRDSVASVETGPMPLFLASKALRPFIGEAFDGMDLSIVQYVDGSKIESGHEATILPKVCEVWLRAKDEGKLQASQLVKAKKAEILMRGLAQVGIIALVDEATGYQYERPRRELEEQLEKFISESLRKWVRTFPPDYFKHLCRLRGVTFRPDMKLPQYFGILTNNIVYKRLAPGLLKRLKERRNEIGRSSNKLHSWLSLDTGFPEVLFHLGAVVDKMKRHDTYEEFEKELNETMPAYSDEPGLFDNPQDWE